MTPAPHCYCTRGTCQECRDQADDMADDDNNTAPVWVHGQHEKEDRTMSDQQTRYYTHFDGDWHYVLDRNSVLSRIRCVVSDDATHIAAALSACDGADDPRPGELARLRAGAMAVKNLDDLARDLTSRIDAIVAQENTTIAAQAAEIKAMRNTLRDFRDNYDCDSDAHRYGTQGHSCRCCVADNILTNTTTESEAE